MDDPQKPTGERDPVPFATVEALAKNIRDLRELEQRKAATQAQLIRWCIRAINQTIDQASRQLEAERVRAQREGKRYCPVRMLEPAKKVREDRRKAILHLEWLATQLENQTVRSPDTSDPLPGIEGITDRKELPCTEV